MIILTNPAQGFVRITTWQGIKKLQFGLKRWHKKSFCRDRFCLPVAFWRWRHTVTCFFLWLESRCLGPPTALVTHLLDAVSARIYWTFLLELRAKHPKFEDKEEDLMPVVLHLAALLSILFLCLWLWQMTHSLKGYHILRELSKLVPSRSYLAKQAPGT